FSGNKTIVERPTRVKPVIYRPDRCKRPCRRHVGVYPDRNEPEPVIILQEIDAGLYRLERRFHDHIFYYTRNPMVLAFPPDNFSDRILSDEPCGGFVYNKRPGISGKRRRKVATFFYCPSHRPAIVMGYSDHSKHQRRLRVFACPVQIAIIVPD